MADGGEGEGDLAGVGGAAIVLGTAAHAKAVLHAAKYPARPVSGLLLGNVSEGDVGLHVEDAVPLSHNPANGALLETATMLVDEYAASRSLRIVGYYHANELLRDNSRSAVTERVADKIHAQFPSAILAMMNSNGLADSTSTGPVELNLYERRKKAAPWTLVNANRVKLEDEAKGARERLTSMLRAGKAADLADFDDHLDDVSFDWRNPTLIDAAV